MVAPPMARHGTQFTAACRCGQHSCTAAEALPCIVLPATDTYKSPDAAHLLRCTAPNAGPKHACCGPMQDWNYIVGRCFELTLELRWAVAGV